MENKFFKTLVAIGTVTAIFAGGNEIAENLKNKPKKSETKEEPKVEEVLDTFKSTDLYVFDKAYKSKINLGEGDFTDSYFIMVDTHTNNCQKFQNVLNSKMISYLNYEISFSNEGYIINQAVSLMTETDKGFQSIMFFDIRGVISLNDFLKSNGLDYLVRDVYSIRDLEYIKQLIENLGIKEYNLKHLAIVDVSCKVNFDYSEKIFLISLDIKNAYDDALIQIIKRHKKVSGYEIYEVINNPNIKRIIITIDYEGNSFLNIFIETKEGQLYTCNMNTEIKFRSLKDFLEAKGLDYLIKDRYTLEELNDIKDNYINSDDFGRVLKK